MLPLPHKITEVTTVAAPSRGEVDSFNMLFHVSFATRNVPANLAFETSLLVMHELHVGHQSLLGREGFVTKGTLQMFQFLVRFQMLPKDPFARIGLFTNFTTELFNDSILGMLGALMTGQAILVTINFLALGALKLALLAF